MSTTYGEFEAQVCRNLGNRVDPDTLAMILNFTNKMMSLMAILHEWEDLQQTSDTTLIAGLNRYSYAQLDVTDLQKLYNITLYDGTRWLPPMKYYPYQHWTRDVQPGLSTSSRPGSFTLIGKKFMEFSCLPADNYPIRIFYYQRPGTVPTLVDEVTPDPSYVLPFEDVDILLEAIVTAYCWLSLQDNQMAQTWFNISKGLADTHMKEARQILNFEVVTRRDVPMVGVPWADPFVRSTK